MLRTSVVTIGAPGARVSTTSGAMSSRVTVATDAAGTTAVVTSWVVSPSRLVTAGAIGAHTTSDCGEPGRVLVVMMGVPGNWAVVTIGVPALVDVVIVGVPGIGTSEPAANVNTVVVVVVVTVVGCVVVAVNCVGCVVVVVITVWNVVVVQDSRGWVVVITSVTGVVVVTRVSRGCVVVVTRSCGVVVVVTTVVGVVVVIRTARSHRSTGFAARSSLTRSQFVVVGVSVRDGVPRSTRVVDVGVPGTITGVLVAVPVSRSSRVITGVPRRKVVMLVPSPASRSSIVIVGFGCRTGAESTLVDGPNGWEGPLTTVGVPDGTAGPTTVVVTVQRVLFPVPLMVPPNAAQLAARSAGPADAGAADARASTAAAEHAMSRVKRRMTVPFIAEGVVWLRAPRRVRHSLPGGQGDQVQAPDHCVTVVQRRCYVCKTSDAMAQVGGPPYHPWTRILTSSAPGGDHTGKPGAVPTSRNRCRATPRAAPPRN